MASEDEGKKAIEELNGKEIEGRQLSVAVAREKENRSGGGGGNYSRSNNRRFS